jgi:Bacterial Ig-like domain
MYTRMIPRLFLIPALIIIVSACAKISSPSGGLRDRLPPVVVKSTPLNGARNFRGKKLEIVFNEYVALDNINDKFMVSPPMKKKPRIFLKGKSVNVEFDDKLKDSTTYTFYFQDAIKDLNEGNILQNYQFVFSTGSVIDSLSVTGNIYNSFNLEAPEKTQVLLYRELADSAVVKHLPEYISRADPNGYFRINNIRPGIYRLYGLKDGDNSKNYNLPDEEFAFMDSTVLINPEKNFIPPPKIVKDTTVVKRGLNKNATAIKDSSNIKKTTLKVAEPVPLIGEYRLFQFAALKKFHYLIKSSRDMKYQLLYVLSLPPDSMKFEFSIPEADSKRYFIEPGRNRDTLKVWLSDSSLYSQPQINTIVRYPYTDTLGILGYKQDTILMRFLAPRVPRVSKVSKVKRTVFTYESNLQTGSLKPGQTIVFKSKTPFREPDTSRIKLYEIVQTTREKLPFVLVKDSSNSCKYYLKTKLEEKKKYLFIADSASFGNIYNEYSDSLGIKFSIKDPELYSQLTLDVKNYQGDRIIQLLDKSERLVAETHLKKDGKVIFPLLESGVYRIRVIYDLNSDGKWTTGDFTTHRQPEPVSFYPQELEMKPGWQLEQTWDIGAKNFKDPKLLEKKKTK